jgi:uncharacterized protein YkvS
MQLLNLAKFFEKLAQQSIPNQSIPVDDGANMSLPSGQTVKAPAPTMAPQQRNKMVEFKNLLKGAKDFVNHIEVVPYDKRTNKDYRDLAFFDKTLSNAYQFDTETQQEAITLKTRINKLISDRDNPYAE